MTHEMEIPLSAKKMTLAANQIIICMGIGTLIYLALQMVGITFPSYVGGMVMGVVLRNVSVYSGKFETPLAEIDSIGNIRSSLFVSMALMSLKLWQLADRGSPHDRNAGGAGGVHRHFYVPGGLLYSGTRL